MLLANEIRLTPDKSAQDAIDIALHRIGADPSSVKSVGVARVSVDARHGAVHMVYNIAVELLTEGAELGFAHCAPNVCLVSKQALVLPKPKNAGARPVICGFGPAGIFAALSLARMGLAPIVLERGAELKDRVADVDKFWHKGILNENSNIQYGEGGAGTFSDGKLTTRINDSLCGFVLDTFLQYGAPAEIAYMQKPHIGTDRLRSVIAGIRAEIISLGGEIHFNTKLTDISCTSGRLNGVYANGEWIECDKLILAIGHSARDTLTMLKGHGLELRAKPFSVGIRVEHLQSEIDKALYHSAAGHPSLPKGEYQLACKVGGRGVYSFCMCPGGTVVAAASENGGVVTNGMSEYARDGLNANAAIAVSLSAEDFSGDADKAIGFLQSLERNAFAAGGGAFVAPACDMASFLGKGQGLNVTAVEPSYPRGVAAADFGRLLGPELMGCLREGLGIFNRRISGFTADSAIITGVETRTSSPVRLERDDSGQSVDIKGLYPCAEGAGYSGGIMSSAVDGIKTALKLY